VGSLRHGVNTYLGSCADGVALSLAAMHVKAPAHSEFSLLAGGPAHWIQQRLGLIKPGAPHLWRRAALAVAVTWVPLLLISAAEGLALGHRVQLPFLCDFSVHARFLVAIPLLILAEGLVEQRVMDAVKHFVHAGLVSQTDFPRFEAAMESCKALRDSVVAEAVLLALTVMSVILTSREFPFNFSTWRSFVSESVHLRTFTGWWYLVVGVGLFQFLAWRWLWRLLIWYRFLWLVAKLDLRLIPTHPDRSAGLGFVGDTQKVFWTVVVACSTTFAGILANEIVYGGVPLENYEFPIAGFAIVVLLFFLVPLLMFTPRLIEAKEKSMKEYGALAVAHNQMFDRKWVQGDNPAGDPMLGTPEISSLADLGSAYEILAKMRAVPFDPADAIVLLLAALLPMTPLLLAIMPLDKLLELLSKILV